MFDFSLLPLFVSVLILTLIVLGIGIHFARNLFVMMLVIPVALVCVFSTYKTVTDILGYPIFQTIPDESLYLAHTNDPNEQFIFVWIIQPKEDRPKNVRILNTEENKQALENAKNRSAKGIPQQMKGSLPPSGYGGPLNKGNYESYDFVLDAQGIK
jgi:hypothetical protein